MMVNTEDRHYNTGPTELPPNAENRPIVTCKYTNYRTRAVELPGVRTNILCTYQVTRSICKSPEQADTREVEGSISVSIFTIYGL